MRKPIIAIDGPAGSGKSTTAKMVAQKLGYFYLDTGAMYRAIALKAFRLGYGPDAGDTIAGVAERTVLEFKIEDGRQRLYMDGEDVSDKIRTPDVTAGSSKISAHPRVREILVARQREIAADGGVVAEGRDTTSVVFPDAEVKVFLIANSSIRAERRHKELEKMGLDSTVPEQLQDITERDRRDSTRDVSPLKKVDGAVEIDTSDLTVEEQVQKVIDLANEVSPA
jgi:cytidylate kinase